MNSYTFCFLFYFFLLHFLFISPYLIRREKKEKSKREEDKKDKDKRGNGGRRYIPYKKPNKRNGSGPSYRELQEKIKALENKVNN